MVLAAGLGMRLRPLTKNRPKAMMHLAGRPLIDWTLQWLSKIGVKECVINLHYLGDQIKRFVGNGTRYGLKVYYSYETKLLGTAGAVKKVEEFFDVPFFVIYSDNFSLWNLKKLIEVYKKHKAIATIAVHWRKDVSQSGVVEMNRFFRVLHLIEKPDTKEVTKSHYVNAGYYYMDPQVFEYIPREKFSDFASDIFPKMIQNGEKIYAVKVNKPVIGIDTVEAYQKANELAIKLSGKISNG